MLCTRPVQHPRIRLTKCPVDRPPTPRCVPLARRRPRYGVTGPTTQEATGVTRADRQADTNTDTRTRRWVGCWALMTRSTGPPSTSRSGGLDRSATGDGERRGGTASVRPGRAGGRMGRGATDSTLSDATRVRDRRRGLDRAQSGTGPRSERHDECRGREPTPGGGVGPGKGVFGPATHENPSESRRPSPPPDCASVCPESDGSGRKEGRDERVTVPLRPSPRTPAFPKPRG